MWQDPSTIPCSHPAYPEGCPVCLFMERRGGMGLVPTFYLLTLNWNLFLNLWHMVLWFSVESWWTGGDPKGTHSAWQLHLIFLSQPFCFLSRFTPEHCFLAVFMASVCSLKDRFCPPFAHQPILKPWSKHKMSRSMVLTLSTFFHTTSTHTSACIHTHPRVLVGTDSYSPMYIPR